MFRKILLATIFTVGASASALAGDWSGFYAGLNGGYGWGKFGYDASADLTTTGPGFPFTASFAAKGHQSSSGFLGGAQGGYDFPSADGLLIGAEVDFDLGSVDTSMGKPKGFPDYAGGVSPLDIHSAIDYLSTSRARIGFSPTSDIGIYATGGFAFGRVSVDAIGAIPQSSTDFLVATGSKSLWRTGWAAGAGVEYPVGDGLTVRAEYLHADLGRATLFNDEFTSDVPFAHYIAHYKVALSTTANIVRVGFNYAFE